MAPVRRCGVIGAIGAIVRTPDDGAQHLVLELGRKGPKSLVGLGPKASLVLMLPLAPQKGIEEGDWSAVHPGSMRFYLLRKAQVAEWLPREACLAGQRVARELVAALGFDIHAEVDDSDVVRRAQAARGAQERVQAVEAECSRLWAMLDASVRAHAAEQERLRAALAPGQGVDVEAVLQAEARTRDPDGAVAADAMRFLEHAAAPCAREVLALRARVADLEHAQDQLRRELHGERLRASAADTRAVAAEQDRAELRRSLAAVEAVLLGQSPAEEGLSPTTVAVMLPLAAQVRRERDAAHAEIERLTAAAPPGEAP